MNTLRLGLSILLLAAFNHASDAATVPKPISDPDMDIISTYIKRTLENLREVMPKGIPELMIPPLEPFKMPVLDIPEITHGMAKVKLGLKNVDLKGLSTFVVRQAKGDAANMAIELDLFFPEVVAKAHYALDGKVVIFPLYGSGPAAIQINDMKIRIVASVGIENMKKVQLTNLNVDLSFAQVQMYLEGILGGGSIADVVNTLLNVMGKLIYDKLKGSICPEVNRILRVCINNELGKVDLQKIIGGGLLPFSSQAFDNEANIYVDRVMENLRPHIHENRLDPISIPEQRAGFSQKIWFVDVWGSARMYNGQARGLSTIHRAGNCDIGSSGTVVTVGCLIGVNEIHGSFDSRVEFTHIGLNAHVTVFVERIRVNIRVRSDLLPGSKPALEHFAITEVTQIRVAVHNLGVLGWIFGSIVNVIEPAVRHHIVAAIERPIRTELEKVIGSVAMPGMV